MQKIIVANWKCNPTTLKEAQKMLSALKAGPNNSKAEVVVCPPFIYLSEAAKMLKAGRLRLGAQNCFWENQGPFTGEVSALMLKNIGVSHVILGHSERVLIMGENNEMTNRKIKVALSLGLRVVVCIGETLEEKQAGKTFRVIEAVFEESLSGLKKADFAKLLLAYEPLWAIGSCHNCSADDAMTAGLFMRKLLAQVASKTISQSVAILYGGSVDAQNAASYLENNILQGLLVGGASLDLKIFRAIIKNITALKNYG